MEEQSEEICAVNPTITDDLVEDLEKIKGDAIGNTLYSEKWVLKTLIHISEYTGSDWTDEFESDLCSLWDMTVENDVVNFLMKHDIISIISRTISISLSTNNNRLTEIMVGLLGNMCCVSQSVRAELSRCEEAINNLLRLFEIPDAPVLIQLVRLIHAVAWDLLKEEDNIPIWLEREIYNFHICNYLTFILKSSTKDELLCGVLEFLNAICSVTINDKDFSQYFATSDLVCGMIESWDQLFSNWSNEDDFIICKQNKKVADHWTAILSSFTGHVNGRSALCENYEKIGDTLNKIIVQPFESADVVLVSAVNILDSIISVYFNKSTFKKLLIIFNSLNQTAGKSRDADFNGDNLEVLFQSVIETYCTSIATFVDPTILNEALKECCEDDILLFWKTVNDRQAEDPGERVV